MPTSKEWSRDFRAFAENWKAKPSGWLPTEEYLGDNPFYHFVLTDEAKLWVDFLRWADQFSDGHWCFRGQREAAWLLHTSLDIGVERQQRTPTAFSVYHLNRKTEMEPLLFRFQQDAHNYLTHVPLHDDLSSWYALMQHFNAPTPLMDWTESPFVAAYFALEDKATERRPEEDEPHSTVWAINLDWLEEKRKQLFEDIVDSNELLRKSAPTVVRINPPMSNPRLFAQQGIFLAKLYERASFGQLLMTMMLRPQLTDIPVIRRIEIGSPLRVQFLKQLRSMNIHRASLFPGLDGLGALLKHDLELRDTVTAIQTRFLSGHEPKVLTSVSEQCSAGRCAECPGIFGREDHGGEAIFCIHDCHTQNTEFTCPNCGGLTPAVKAGTFENLIAGRVTCRHCGHEFTTPTY